MKLVTKKTGCAEIEMPVSSYKDAEELIRSIRSNHKDAEFRVRVAHTKGEVRFRRGVFRKKGNRSVFEWGDIETRPSGVTMEMFR